MINSQTGITIALHLGDIRKDKAFTMIDTTYCYIILRDKYSFIMIRRRTRAL